MATRRPLQRPWPPALRMAGVAVAMVALLTAALLDLRNRSTPARGAGTDRSNNTEPAGASASPQQDRTPAAALLPNLRVLPAEELGIEVLGPSRTLRFASVLFNVGDGPLLVAPRRDESCPARQRHVVETVALDGDGDGEFVAERDADTATLPGGCMLFHPQHDHWHFDGSAAYALTSVTDDVPIVAKKKVSFCLRDSERLRGARTVERDRTLSCSPSASP